METKCPRGPLEPLVSLHCLPVAWAKPADLDCLAFSDGHSLPGIRAHETNEHTEPLYAKTTMLVLIEALRGMCWIEAENMMDGDEPCAEMAKALEAIERFTGFSVRRDGQPMQANAGVQPTGTDQR